MEYPKIVRDAVDFTSDTEVCNIGYHEGTLSDGRPYRIEVWSAFGIETATIFISTQDIEDKDVKFLKKLIQDNKIIDIFDDRLDVTRTVDYEENEFYSINIPLVDHDEEINTLLVNLKDYYEE